MKYIQKPGGKEEIPYKFPSPKVEQQYITICEKLWGGVPCDVNWAQNTNLYKQTLLLWYI